MIICGLINGQQESEEMQQQENDTENNIENSIANDAKNSVEKQLQKKAIKFSLKTLKTIFMPVIILLLKFVLVVVLVGTVVSILAAFFNFINNTINNNNNGTINSAQSDDLLKLFIRAWEAEGGATTNEDGSMYIVVPDGGGGLAVGYGVDINAHGDEIRSAGYSTSEGSEIPVDFIDDIEERELEHNKEVVEKATEGLGLEEYQKHALISRVYNCGEYGWEANSATGEAFEDAYKKYWKSSDLQYGVTASDEMFDSSLYLNYLIKPNTSNGNFLSGLQSRREAEWILFKTGWYGYNRSDAQIQTFYYNYVSTTSSTSYSNWDGSGNTFGLEIYKNGHVDDEAMVELRSALEDYYGLPKMKGGLTNENYSSDLKVTVSNITNSTGYKKYDYLHSSDPAQCVWWAYVRCNQYLKAYGTKYSKIDDCLPYIKTEDDGILGDGEDWGKRYSQVFDSGSEPATNSIFSYGGGDYGHVGYVEAVDGEYLYITHCGSGTWWRGLDKIEISTFKSNHPDVTFVYITSPK